MCLRYENLLLNGTAPPPNLARTFVEGTWESSQKHGWNLHLAETMAGTFAELRVSDRYHGMHGIHGSNNSVFLVRRCPVWLDI